MYINFWYAMEESKNVTADKPSHVKRLNQDFVLWRDDQGKVHCLHDVCSHRGARLSKGEIRNNCVQCPYHGWRFQGSGDCDYIPSLGKHNQKFPQRTRIDSYPVEEHYGVIFAFLGDLPESERPPLLLPHANPKNQDYTGPQWRHATLGWDIKSNYERCIENGLDPSHNEFVHPSHGFKGQNLDEYFVPEYDVEHHDWGQGFMVDFNAPPPTHEVAKQSGRTEAAKIKAGAGHNGPNQVWTYIEITPEMWAHQYLYETPVDSRNTHAINVSLVNFVNEETSDDEINAMNAYIAEQDVVVLNEVMPITTPDDTSSEVMMPSDKCVLEYRRYLKRWDQRGYRIDAKKVEAEYGEKVYAIPSPRRRTEKGWVFPPVPLVPGREG
jgi:phenylpropionate dioxygenase-like ring-hydroxylating dioxygenase large terminal subunit